MVVLISIRQNVSRKMWFYNFPLFNTYVIKRGHVAFNSSKVIS